MTARAILTDDKGNPVRDLPSKRILMFPNMQVAARWAQERYGDEKTIYIEPLEPIDPSVTRAMNRLIRKDRET